MKRPNILWLSYEDTSPRLGCYGDAVARTPHTDALAAEGCVYRRAFSTAPVCAPSRHAAITGMYATYTGCHHMRTAHKHVNPDCVDAPFPYIGVPPAYVKCVSEYFRAAGYYCTNNDKTDYQFGVPESAWDDCSSRGHWRNGFEGGSRPFFSVFNFMMTHESGMWDPPEHLYGQPPMDRPLPQDPAVNAERYGIREDLIRVPPYLPDTPAVRKALLRHYVNIARVDERVGEVLGQLREDGLMDDTVVVLWSDHGEGLPRCKRWPLDSGTRVPMIVRAPGRVKAGSESDELVSLIDLPSTMLSLAGLPVPAHLQGHVFLGEQRDKPREHVFATRDRYDESYDKVRSVRDSRYRYVRNYYPNQEREIWVPFRNRHPAMQAVWEGVAGGTLTGGQRWFAENATDNTGDASWGGWGGRPAEELYDLQSDPHECENLAGKAEHRGTLKGLSAALDEWQRKHDRYLDVSEEEMVRGWFGNTPEGRPGKQPVTMAPFWVAVGGGQVGRAVLRPGEAVNGSTLLQLCCATEGASLEWRVGEGAWRLYTGPIRVRGPGGLGGQGGQEQVVVEARAVRYGYVSSEVVRTEVRIGGGVQ